MKVHREACTRPICHLSASGLGFRATNSSAQPLSSPERTSSSSACYSHCWECYFHTIWAARAKRSLLVEPLLWAKEETEALELTLWGPRTLPSLCAPLPPEQESSLTGKASGRCLFQGAFPDWQRSLSPSVPLRNMLEGSRGHTVRSCQRFLVSSFRFVILPGEQEAHLPSSH